MPSISCPKCARQIDVYPEDIGTKIECAVCNARFTVNKPTKPPPPLQPSLPQSVTPKHTDPARRSDLPPFNTIIGSASVMAGICAASMNSLPIFWPLTLPLGLLGLMLGISAVLSSNRKRFAGGIIGAIGLAISFFVAAGFIIGRMEKERKQLEEQKFQQIAP